MSWKKGLNFNRAKYEILDRNTFIPCIHSNLKATIPMKILTCFVPRVSNNLVALLEIRDITTGKAVIRIKKLHRSGKSLAFSLEKERNFKNIVIKVLAIKNVQDCLARPNLDSLNINGKLLSLSTLPSHTLDRSFPYSNSRKVTPLFAFEYRNKLYCGTHFGWKNLILKKEITSDDTLATALGLYFAEGGKTSASFTNSQPSMINMVLDFIENVTNVRRNDVSASIYCHPALLNKEKNLEDFWSSQAGITKFSSNLHLSSNSKSPCGTLELKFSSIILKEFLCGLLQVVFKNPSIINPKNLVRGIFSAESSPIRQTKTCITHHITLDRHNWELQFNFINTFVSKLGIKLATVPVKPSQNTKQIHAVVYSDWLTNLMILLFDVYQFNLINREKFCRQFLSLPKTNLFLKLENGGLITGEEIVSGCRIFYFKKLGLITLDQISPKPHRKYEVQLTEKGLEVKTLLQNFVDKAYPKYRADLEKFYKTLEGFDLPKKVVG